MRGRYRRRFYRRKFSRTGRRRFGYTKKYRSGRFGRKVRKALQVETKEDKHDLTTSYSSIGTTWTDVGYGGAAWGSASANACVGNSLAMTKFEVKGWISAGAVDSAADDAYNMVRMVIYKNLAPSSNTTPLQTAGITLQTGPLKEARNCPNGIVVLWDKTICVKTTVGHTGYIPTPTYVYKKITFKKPFKVTKCPDSAYPNKDLRFACLSDSGVVPNAGFVAGWVRALWIDV